MKPATLSRGMALALLLLGSLAFLLPFYIMLAMSLKTPAEIATSTVWSWPKSTTWENYREVVTNPNVVFRILLKNTAVIAALSTLGTVVSSVSVAYAFARLRFPGRDRLFLVLLATMMLPGIITLIPSYVMFAKLHWINTFLPLVVPAFFAGAFNVFLLRQFFLGIPRELDEAALIDGASHARILSSVILPLSGPALATVAIFAFVWTWRDFMGPLLYLNDPDRQTLEVGLRMYQSVNSEQWHLLMAASVLVSLPLLLLFLIGQRAFVKGIVMTGGK